MNKTELGVAMIALGLGPYPDLKLHEMIVYYDGDGSRSITYEEFEELVLYEEQVLEETRPRHAFIREGGEGESRPGTREPRTSRRRFTTHDSE